MIIIISTFIECHVCLQKAAEALKYRPKKIGRQRKLSQLLSMTNIIFQYVRKHRDKLTELFYNAAL